ncbi:ferrous iron transport protein B [Corynebacterium hindlerae]|uniref:Ferrous iron transport protein B n=1 Tax=Corynebacterium hindlerae TaxID=699041 RepID=A0A7G5FIK4_9CORY|nr:ferrous iron transport protein B [Corynebacterium hindlerae]
MALIGAPNSGKSTTFNTLTGAKVKTGNWPGTSVEVSRGVWKTQDGMALDVIDFPGTYSLDPLSPDEELTRDMLIERAEDERPDLAVVVVDATAPARGLNLAFQLAEHPYRIVLAVTKMDLAQAQGISVDVQRLAEVTGIPAVVVNGRKFEGLADLEQVVLAQLGRPKVQVRVGDGVEKRFADLDDAVKAAVVEGEERETWTQRIDRVVLRPFLGPLIFLGVMWLVFKITITVAAPLQDGLESLINGWFGGVVSDGLAAAGWDHPLVTGLLVDGLIGSVGMVLTFAPLLALMFLCLAVLEDSGYMARAAVVTDRVMQSIGLPGKAFIPIVVGFGCNVPVISATRVLGSPRHRILTSLLIPFTSCSARLIVFLMLATIFFPDHAGSAVFAMYVLSIVLIVVTGLLLRSTLWRAMPSEALVIDLPTYQLPTARMAGSVTWQRLRGFLETAGGIIVTTVVVVWLLMAIPVRGDHDITDVPPQDSAFGVVSETISPVFQPAGFGSWSLTGPLITGFVAKEAVISTWAHVYAVEDVTDAAPEEQAESALSKNIRQDFEDTSGGHALAAVWAFIIFMLSYTPCAATIAAQRREIGAKWTLFGFAVQFAGSWILAVVAFQILKVFL